MLDLELSALQADGYGEQHLKWWLQISSLQKLPRVSLPINNQFWCWFNSNNVNALLSLDVTPSITPDGKIN